MRLSSSITAPAFTTIHPSVYATPAAPRRPLAATLIQLIELAIVGVMGLPALLAEQMEPGLLMIGLSLLLLPLILRLLFMGRPAAPTLALWPLLFLALLTLLTVRITPSWQHTWPELVRLLWGIALCLAIFNWINPAQPVVWPAYRQQRHLPTRLIWATLGFFALGATLTIIGLLAMGSTNKIAQFDAWLALLPKLEFAARSGFNPNRVAGVAVLLAPLALALALGPLLPRARPPQVWLGWLATKSAATLLALLFSLALLLTQSRSSWLALGCALLIMLPLLGRRGWLLLGALALLGIGGVAALGPNQLLDKLTVYDARQVAPDALLQDRNLAGRLILWQRALHGLADAPLTGMGLGAFEAVSQQPYPQVAAYQPDPDMTHVHNIVLQVGLDLGVPGIIAFVSLLLLLGRLLVCLLRQAATSSPLHTWSVGLLGSLAAYWVYNMFDALTLGARPSVMVWFLFGLCLGAGEWAQTTIPRRVVARPTSSQRPAAQTVAAQSQPAPTSPYPEAPPMAEDAWEERAWQVIAGKKE